MLQSVAKSILRHHKMTALNAGVGGIFAMGTYDEARQSGDGVMSSVLQAGGDFAGSMLMGGGLYMGLQMVAGGGEAAIQGYNALDQKRHQVGRDMRQAAFSSAQFNDTEQTYTMRQAGMAIARRARGNADLVQLGNEAKFMAK